eukprot:Protomagalhaensia_wolfi_Nauph_80__6134@NODE_889_length_1908_cov_59_432317_g668_i0_p2_GENE_NODE_889_length_1908_cov_59_432317_g668_i0NODE_889_length_1908_cov_59_432317_g668_i0_p2_ORF_typecomplete_len135_score10_14Iron_permease/PF04120_12/0_15DUF5475/PF17569_2/0_19DUF5475/PF17569_2/4_7e03_NODE_889_length_1908_cov_59_432317_g668_i09261330
MRTTKNLRLMFKLTMPINRHHTRLNIPLNNLLRIHSNRLIHNNLLMLNHLTNSHLTRNSHMLNHTHMASTPHRLMDTTHLQEVSTLHRLAGTLDIHQHLVNKVRIATLSTLKVLLRSKPNPRHNQQAQWLMLLQ